jgi:hypothetical protein
MSSQAVDKAKIDEHRLDRSEALGMFSKNRR